jgi:hypothetical protein
MRIVLEENSKVKTLKFCENFVLRSYDLEFLVDVMKKGRKEQKAVIFKINPGEAKEQLRKMNFDKLGVVIQCK